MPQSTHRHKHKHPSHATLPHHEPAAKARPKSSAAILMAIFIGTVGLAIGWLATGMNYGWMVASTAIGVVSGLLIGRGIDRSIEKKKV